jgi:hypothetical protein
MLTLWGNRSAFCDGITRRDFLRVGSLGSLTLPTLFKLRAEGATAQRSPRSLIMVCLFGGPSHLETYDMKPDAPDGIRGDFKPVHSNVPGFDMCEHMPLQAQIADKLAVVRTVQFVEPMQHELQEVFTGFPKASHRPALGSVISRLRSPADHGMPAYVSLNPHKPDEYESPQYLGPAHRPFLFGTEGVRDLGMAENLTLDRLQDRKRLLGALDTMHRDLEAGSEFKAIDAFTAQAFDMISSPRAKAAFDLSRESESTRRRYGIPGGKFSFDNDPNRTRSWPAEKFLLARRLVEAGVGVVTLAVGSWDYHGTKAGTGGIFPGMRRQLPLLDQSLHALVTDLHERGLDQEVAVLVWGEFGRSPKITYAGRDHWPDVGFALFAGGGMKMGQVVGDTDSKGARVRTRPVGAQNVVATIYRLLGINPQQTFPDFNGRPQYLLEDREPIQELIG